MENDESYSDEECSLALSCSVSSYEEDDDGQRGVAPYMFEPNASGSEEDSTSVDLEDSELDGNDDRLNNTDWYIELVLHVNRLITMF